MVKLHVKTLQRKRPQCPESCESRAFSSPASVLQISVADSAVMVLRSCLQRYRQSEGKSG